MRPTNFTVTLLLPFTQKRMPDVFFSETAKRESVQSLLNYNEEEEDGLSSKVSENNECAMTKAPEAHQSNHLQG